MFGGTRPTVRISRYNAHYLPGGLAQGKIPFAGKRVACRALPFPNEIAKLFPDVWVILAAGSIIYLFLLGCCAGVMPPSRPLETSMEATVASISLTGWVRAFQTTGLGPDGAVKTARGWFILTWEPWAHRGPRSPSRKSATFLRRFAAPRP